MNLITTKNKYLVQILATILLGFSPGAVFAAEYATSYPSSGMLVSYPSTEMVVSYPSDSMTVSYPSAKTTVSTPASGTKASAPTVTSSSLASIGTGYGSARFETSGAGNSGSTFYGYSSPTMYEYSYGGGYYSGSRYTSSYDYSSAPLVLPYSTSKTTSSSNPQKITSNLQLPYSTGGVSSNSNPQTINSNLQLTYSVGEVNSNSSPISVNGKLKLPYEVGDVDAVEYRDYDMDGKLVLPYKTGSVNEGELAGASSIYLNQVPYTGPEETAKVVGFISLVIVWSGLVAYYFVKRRQKSVVSNRIEAFKKMNLASVTA